MEVGQDLSAEALSEHLLDRPLRAYPALLSTEADALAWARAGAPEGAVVVADYQAAPRGRAGLLWRVEPGRGLAFSLVLRPRLSPEREGWLYTVATSGLADVAGEEAGIEWPDEVKVGRERNSAVGIQAGFGAHGTEWAVVTVLVEDAAPPRGPLLERVVAAIEARLRERSADVLSAYLERCATLGRRVRARMIPMGPGGPEFTGRAVSALKDGALLLETAEGRRVAVRPQNLGLLEESPSEDASTEIRSPGG